MSYKNIEINTTQKPDSSNSITLSLDHLSDIDVSTNSPNNNEILKYDGSNWIASALSATYEASAYGFAASNKNTGGGGGNYTDDNDSTSNGRYGILTDTRNSGYGNKEVDGGVDFLHKYANVNGTTLSNNRYGVVELPANGKFLLIASISGVFSGSSSSATLCWCDSSYNKLGNQVFIEPDGRGSKKLYGYIETSGSTKEVHIGTLSISGTLTTKSKVDSQSWQVIKVG